MHAVTDPTMRHCCRKYDSIVYSANFRILLKREQTPSAKIVCVWVGVGGLHIEGGESQFLREGGGGEAPPSLPEINR